MKVEWILKNLFLKNEETYIDKFCMCKRNLYETL